MKKNLFMAAMTLVLLIGLNACCTYTPGKIVYSNKLQGTIEDVGAKAAILVTKDGKILVYDENGNGPGSNENISECRLPKPGEDTARATIKTGKAAIAVQPTSKINVCRGMGKGSAVTSVRTISIVKSNSLDCVTIGVDARGNPIEVCWPAQ